jgi:hypothetical protein
VIDAGTLPSQTDYLFPRRETIMADEGGNRRQRDAMGVLSLNLFCMEPDVKDLLPEQQCALHEFFHVVLAAGYKLYQTVPPKYADPILEKKFGIVFPKDQG